MIDFEKELNQEQLAVVQAVNGKIACVAAAGSGKTRCIIYRIAYILEKGYAKPEEIIVVTFTNKAAEEIKHRLSALLPDVNVKKMLIGTFHSVCIKLLHKYKRDFEFDVLTDSKQKLIVKDIMEKNNIIEISIDNALQYIQMKTSTLGFTNHQMFVNNIDPSFDLIYNEYIKVLQNISAIDFNMIILQGINLLKIKEIKEQIHNQYKYIMVDEFQDSNIANFKLTELLAEKHNNLMVVGDDYQAIYGWRYADVSIFMNFVKSADKVLYLSTNYRSTKTIVDASAAIIKNNKNQLEKSIKAASNAVGRIKSKVCYDQNSERMFLINEIKKLIKQGHEYKDIMVLVRNRNVSENIEYDFISNDIPYSFSKEKEFSERFEVKTLINYLVFLNNPYNVTAGIELISDLVAEVGKATHAKIYSAALYAKKSLLQIIDEELDNIPRINKAAKEALRKFSKEIHKLQAKKLPPQKYICYVIRNSRLYLLAQEDDDIMFGLKEFLNFMQVVIEENDDIETTSDLINYILIKSMEVEVEDRVNILTVHASKGLEAKFVFLIGCDQNIFPSFFCNSPDLKEEERRLFYVAMTRAKTMLYLSTCKRRVSHDQVRIYDQSEFVKEIPEKFVEVLK